MSVVSLVGVHKSYGTWPVLQGVDLMVPDGARIGIIGPNGAGKSTLLRIVGGTEDVNEGEVVRRRGVTVSYLEQNPEGDDRTADAYGKNFARLRHIKAAWDQDNLFRVNRNIPPIPDGQSSSE